MRRVRARSRKSQPCVTEVTALERDRRDGAVSVAMIQALIPLAFAPWKTRQRGE